MADVTFFPINDDVLKSHICEDILHSLPQWFGIESAILDYSQGVKGKFFLAAKVKEDVVGIISIKENTLYTDEIYVMGIKKEFHRTGIGKELVERAAQHSRKMNKWLLSVKTLSDFDSDVNYAKTRKFYLAMGFYPLEEITELWGEENPCLIMVKVLRGDF